MSGAHVLVNQAANSTPNGTQDVSRVDVWQSQPMHFIGISSDGQTSPVWTILAWPFDSARQQPTDATSFDATYTPDVPGSYRVQFLVDDGLVANKNVFIFAVTRNSTGLIIDGGLREPAYGEETGEDTSASNDRGYARAFELGMAAEIVTVDTKTELRTMMAYRHTQVHLLGLATKGDGLGGLFYWDAASTVEDDDTNILTPTGLATGRWIRTALGTGDGTFALDNLGLSDFPTGGSIGSAASTVDLYSSVTILQTTAAQTLTIPDPTDTATRGLMLVSAAPAWFGSVAFSIGSSAGPKAYVAPGCGAVFRWDGTLWALCGVGFAGAVPDAPPYDAQTFTTPGAFDCTLPTGAYTSVRVRIWAGGGGGGGGQVSAGGGSGGSGAGGGAYVERTYTFAELGGSGAVIAGSVGAGGAAGATGADGGVGGTSWFGSWVVAYGGGPGTGNITSRGGSGGGATGPGSSGALQARGGGVGAPYAANGTAGVRGIGYEGAGTNLNYGQPGTSAVYGGGSGANGGNTSDVGAAGGQSLFGGGGGGSGGGTNTGASSLVGGAGGLAGANTTGATAGGGGTAGAAATAGGAGASIAGRSGSGGGGGGGNSGSGGKAGGAGGDRGGAGGGAGACSSGTGAAGGPGGRGQIDVTCT